MSDSGERAPKLFTIIEANALLPQVRALLDQLQGLERSVEQTDEQLAALIERLKRQGPGADRALSDEYERVERHQLQLVEAFRSTADQLAALGAVLKDLRAGLIDFYTLQDDQVAYLCWKQGEPSIRFWHTLDSGYAGRQPVR